MPSKNLNPDTRQPVQSWSELNAAAQATADTAFDKGQVLLGDVSGPLIRPSEVVPGVRRVSQAALDVGVVPVETGTTGSSGPALARRAFKEATHKPVEETISYPQGITIGGIRRLREQQNSDA